MQENSEVVSVRMPAQTRKKLASIAKGMDRSQNWLVNEAIENYLSVYDWQKEEIRKAVAEADRGGKFYSASEVARMIETFKP